MFSMLVWRFYLANIYFSTKHTVQLMLRGMLKVCYCYWTKSNFDLMDLHFTSHPVETHGCVYQMSEQIIQQLLRYLGKKKSASRLALCKSVPNVAPILNVYVETFEKINENIDLLVVLSDKSAARIRPLGQECLYKISWQSIFPSGPKCWTD